MQNSCTVLYFAVLADDRVKLKETENKDKYLDLPRELKKTVENESDDYTNCNWYSWYIHRRIGKETGGFGNNRTSGDLSNYCIIEIGQNTEKSPGNFRRLAVSQITLKTHQLSLM